MELVSLSDFFCQVLAFSCSVRVLSVHTFWLLTLGTCLSCDYLFNCRLPSWLLLVTLWFIRWWSYLPLSFIFGTAHLCWFSMSEIPFFGYAESWLESSPYIFHRSPSLLSLRDIIHSVDTKAGSSFSFSSRFVSGVLLNSYLFTGDCKFVFGGLITISIFPPSFFMLRNYLWFFTFREFTFSRLLSVRSCTVVGLQTGKAHREPFVLFSPYQNTYGFHNWCVSNYKKCLLRRLRRENHGCFVEIREQCESLYRRVCVFVRVYPCPCACVFVRCAVEFFVFLRTLRNVNFSNFFLFSLQLKARAVTAWRHNGDHGGELSVFCWWRTRRTDKEMH